MKKLFLSLLAVFALTTSYAQKEVVVVENFGSTDQFGDGDVTIIRNQVIAALQNTKRVILIDVKNQEAQAKEAIRRASEEAASDNRAVSDIGTMAANYILKGYLNTITVTTKYREDYKTKQKVPYAYAELNYTITLIDPATGATVSTRPCKITAESDNSNQEARAKAINNSGPGLASFIEECFPIKGKVLQIAEEKNGKAKSVYIDLGSEAGLTTGQMFDVYEIVDIAGERSESVIGSIKCVEVMSGKRALCKVSSGGDIISTKLAGNKELTIKSRARNSWF